MNLFPIPSNMHLKAEMKEKSESSSIEKKEKAKGKAVIVPISF